MNLEFRIMIKEHIIKKVFILIILNSIFFIQYSTQVHAQALDLSVAPPIFEVELTPPAVASAKETIVLTNNSDNTLELKLIFRQFAPNKEDGTLSLLPDNEPIRGRDPLILQRIQVRENNIPIETVTIPPKSEKKLDLRISVPKDEPPSDYYLSLIFLSLGTDGTSTQTTTSGGIGINLLLSIGPKSVSTATIEEFSTPRFVQSGSVPFTTRVKNTSSHFLSPKGQIIITNMFGQTVGNVELIPVNILAQSIRALPSKEQVIFEANKPSKKEDEEITELERLSADHPVGIWNEKFLLGPYKASLRMALTDEGPILKKTIWFFALPTQLLFGIAIALLVILLIRNRLKARAHTH